MAEVTALKRKGDPAAAAPAPDNRAALAQAISSAAEAKSRVQHQEHAISRAIAGIDETETALAKAAADIAKAKERDTERAASAIAANRDMVTATRTAAALENERGLTARLELQRAARVRLEEQLAEARGRCSRRTERNSRRHQGARFASRANSL